MGKNSVLLKLLAVYMNLIVDELFSQHTYDCLMAVMTQADPRICSFLVMRKEIIVIICLLMKTRRWAQFICQDYLQYFHFFKNQKTATKICCSASEALGRRNSSCKKRKKKQNDIRTYVLPQNYLLFYLQHSYLFSAYFMEIHFYGIKLEALIISFKSHIYCVIFYTET